MAARGIPLCHPCGGRGPGKPRRVWIPACAGMTRSETGLGCPLIRLQYCNSFPCKHLLAQSDSVAGKLASFGTNLHLRGEPPAPSNWLRLARLHKEEARLPPFHHHRLRLWFCDAAPSVNRPELALFVRAHFGAQLSITLLPPNTYRSWRPRPNWLCFAQWPVSAHVPSGRPGEIGVVSHVWSPGHLA
jgi:hypothetical protein